MPPRRAMSPICASDAPYADVMILFFAARVTSARVDAARADMRYAAEATLMPPLLVATYHMRMLPLLPRRDTPPTGMRDGDNDAMPQRGAPAQRLRSMPRWPGDSHSPLYYVRRFTPYLMPAMSCSMPRVAPPSHACCARYFLLMFFIFHFRADAADEVAMPLRRCRAPLPRFFAA